MDSVPSVTLHDGTTIPQLGYGTYKVGVIPSGASGQNGVRGYTGHDATEVVLQALKTGYRMLDCAPFYENEQQVGEAIKRSGIPRKELCVISKVWNSAIFNGPDAVRKQVEQTLSDLQTPYLDICLVHWPVPGKHVAAYQALEALRDEGKVRSVGVSNYTIENYKELMEGGVKVRPTVNQIELNPLLNRRTTRAFFEKEGVVLMAYRPLMQGKVAQSKALCDIAGKHKKTVAQVCERWCLQLGAICIPKSETPSRIKENFEVFDFALDDDDMAQLGSLTEASHLESNRVTYLKCIVRDTPLSLPETMSFTVD